MSIIIVGISSAFFNFYLYKKRKLSVINFAATYEKILYYDKIKVSEGIGINKSNKSKEYMICHYWYFLDGNYKYKPEVCNSCHDISMMDYESENITTLNIKGIDYRCVVWNMTRNNAINRLNKSKLDDKGSL